MLMNWHVQVFRDTCKYKTAARKLVSHLSPLLVCEEKHNQTSQELGESVYHDLSF